MSRTALSVQTISETGTVPTLGSADNSNGNTYPYSGKEWVMVKNGSGSSRIVTIVIQQASVQVPGMGTLAPAAHAITLADGETGLIPPVPAALFQDPSDGLVDVNISGTGVTIAVFKAPG